MSKAGEQNDWSRSHSEIESQARKSKQKPLKSHCSSKAPIKAPVSEKLYEQLGRTMVDQLVRDLQFSRQENLSLLDKLSNLGAVSLKPTSDEPNSFVETLVETGHPLEFQRPVLDPVSVSGASAHSTDSRSSQKVKSAGHNNVFTLRDFAAVVCQTSVLLYVRA